MPIPPPEPAVRTPRAFLYLGMLIAAYIGVYLCRKNLAVAVPLIQQDWGLSKEQVGLIASVSTVVYAAGKIGFGPITDRLGGRTTLIGSILLVAGFGLAGAFAPSLAALTVIYSANRLAGSASWGAMVKLVSEWFPSSRLAFACGLLSLSFVFGGALAVAFAGVVARLSGESWRAVLGAPSLVLAGLVVVLWLGIGGQRGVPPAAGTAAAGPAIGAVQVRALFRERTFLVILALSFALNLLRETFNFWTVDFIHTEGGSRVSSSLAAFLSTPFDICGALGIVLVGWAFGRLAPSARQVFLALMLGILALLLAAFPLFFQSSLPVLTVGVGLVGFLAYGPYSLLAGVLAVEVRGRNSAATVAGLVDGVGYFAGVLSGVVFGKLLTLGGYRLGFLAMAAVTAIAAGLCCLLYHRPASAEAVPAAFKANPDYETT